MISILTAGDKHFFKYVEQVKKQTDINLNLWGINPLEVTHFKAGFLGVPPDFEENHVYSNGALKQLRYQFLRLKAMSQSLGYFNSSIFDTLSGEYYRSFTKKLDYFHVVIGNGMKKLLMIPLIHMTGKERLIQRLHGELETAQLHFITIFITMYLG